MRRIQTLSTLAVGLLALLGVGQSAVQAAQAVLGIQHLTLTVRVYTLTPEAAAYLPRAFEEATLLLEDAGLEVRWLDCPAGRARAAVCDQAPEPGDIRLRIVGGAGKGESEQPLGYALPLERGSGVNAAVLFKAIERTSSDAPVSTAQLLGFVMAHEIGHLLLGTNSHSPTGLMTANWDQDDLRTISQRRLRFTELQTRRIRQDARARMLAATPPHGEPLLAMSPAAAGIAGPTRQTLN
jgi:hypothetical protein